ncbi:hypothetical protein TrispH2_011272 [Trichoplax sp. H2]|nr:hypothetical protein TrispH2_011272 [Trichoplax sp. H2]|eukprot:RDD37253.1 hypothetical protein TrispH2_011272 [Trichoplax sp. H2]
MKIQDLYASLLEQAKASAEEAAKNRKQYYDSKAKNRSLEIEDGVLLFSSIPHEEEEINQVQVAEAKQDLETIHKLRPAGSKLNKKQ